METLESEGLHLSAEQEAQLRKAEEEIIQKEILPVLTEKIEPVLAQIERELVLVVDYVPGTPLKVSLSRKRNLTEVFTDAVEIKPDPEVPHKTYGTRKVAKGEIAPKTALRVTKPDGSVIAKSTAKAPTTNTFKRSNEIGESTKAQTSYRIVDYSERAIAVYGVPKIYTEKFKEIGGYFDKHLKEGEGWIFSKKIIDDVRKILSTQSIKIEDCPPSLNLTPKHKNSIVQARNKQTPVPGKLSIGNFIYYLYSIKNAYGRNFTPSSISVYSSATRSDYMSEKVRKYDSTGVIYNIKDKKLLVKLYNDVKDDVENGHKSQSFLKAIKLYLQFFEEMTSSNEHKDDISLIHNEAQQTTLPFENETNSKSDSTSSKREKVPNIIINSIKFDAYNITQGNSTEKFIEFINSIGPDLVYEMYIPFREGLLVDKTRNLKYFAFCKQLNDGFWLNSHSSTLTKIELMRKICENLDIEIHIDFEVPDLVS